MSTPQRPAPPKTRPGFNGEPVIWGLLGEHEHLQGIDEYVSAGGYEQLKRAITLEPDALIQEIKDSNIRGRGGAGFPTGLKLSFIPKDSPKAKYVVCNADESEPSTFKDREIMERLPHMLIEGCLIAAHAIGAKHAFIYIRGEFYEPALVLMQAVEEARATGLVGENVAGSGWNCDVIVHRGAGAYICGEETALLSSLNGYRGQPTVKPPFPAVSGLYESPTLVNNVETLATLPRILAIGGATYGATGVGRMGAGTRMMSLSGNVVRPGNYEMEIGQPLRVLIEQLGGGIPEGRALKAIIPGGSSTPVLRADQVDTSMDYDSMVAEGTMFGSGSVIVIDERTCMAQLALRVAEFYRHESCGKCTPCREGTKWTVDVITRIVAGGGRPGDVDLLYSICSRILGNCLCPLGDAMAMPIMSYIDHFREDFDRYLEPGFEAPTDGPVADIAKRAVEAAGVSKPGVTWAGTLTRDSFTPLAMAGDGAKDPELMATATLTIDGREVTVPAGSGLVEAAAELGVEIPVFCYEPRIGPAVGACRMCLVEIEGVPKLQAACATGVRDGMVVSTVGDKAREAQEAVLEFLLVNHPLDCPVCDKGGECPLQDHAFRWGPGATRFQELKRVNDKPIPISPLIALDRERCILCYRCSRFSAEVSEDLQLIARERGASSVIATFEGRPYEATHSGNVIELCPVGALTSTQYRFQARPWEAPDHPSIAPWDPVGTNVFNTVREGRVVRVLSRRNDAVDVGWIDDRTRFAYAAMNGPARITAPQHRPNRERPVGNRQVVEQSHELAMEWLHGKLTAEAAARELWVLSGSETLEVVHAIQQLAAQTGGRVVAVPGASAALPTNSAAIADLGSVQHVLVLGHADLLDTAPAFDLWLRKARQRGASVTVAGMGGTRLEGAGSHFEHVAPGGMDAFVASFCARITAATGADGLTEPGIVIHRDGELSDESIELLASTFGFPRDGSGFLAISSAPNARGLAAMGVETLTWDDILGHTGGVVYVGVDPDRWVDVSEWGPAVKRAAWVAAIDALPTPLHDSADLVIPAAWGGEQDGTLVNLEGRLQRMSVGADTPGEVLPQLRWIAGLARRLGASVPGNAAGAFRQLAETTDGRLPVTTQGAIPQEGILGVHGGPPARRVEDTAIASQQGELALYVAPNLYDSAEVQHTEAMDFLHAQATLQLNRADATAFALVSGDRARLEVDGREVEVTIRTSRRVTAGHARVHAGTPGFAPGRTGWTVARVVGSTGSDQEPRVGIAAGSPSVGAGDQLDAPPTIRPQDGEG